MFSGDLGSRVARSGILAPLTGCAGYAEIFRVETWKISRCSMLGPPIMATSNSWFFWAVLSAVFAALTAIFAKIGIQGVDSDLATLVRTIVIVFVLSAFVWFAGKWSNPFELSSRT